MDSNAYLSFLNPEQKQAVMHNGKSLLILAGAGSGKTRVITTKIAYLISELHFNPHEILAVTFTKKAAAEMKERAVALEPNARWSQIRTFHSFGAFFLRTYYSAFNLDPNFTVYDDDDTVSLITKAVPALTRKEAAHFAHLISLAKDYCILPQDEVELSTISTDPKFAYVYDAYEKRLRSTGNVDFGDLILIPYLILKNNSFIADEVHRRYRVIMVDEYQDSNVAQFKLLQELSGVNTEDPAYVCVVGDDDQSIYKFRGAEVQNILNFQKLFPGTDLIKLETNYRSTAEILNSADSVVSKNEGRLGKTLKAFRGKGKKPALVFLPTQEDETDFCADMIEQAYSKGVPYSDWAILYRTNAQSSGFETLFAQRKIPYAVVGSLKFYEREEIKDALCWISLIANPKDEIAFRRIINKPVRGIGSTTQDKICEEGKGKNLIETAHNYKLSKKAREGFNQFESVYNELSKMIPEIYGENENAVLASQASGETVQMENKNEGQEQLMLSYFMDAVIKKSGLEDFHKAQDELSDTSKVLNLQELVNSAALYPCTRDGLLDFLDHVNLDRTLETEEDSNSTDRVTLITLHNTKGLEFPRVIITGMEAGIFPREGKTVSEIEEERRIFYVGITRAQNELYFTSCYVRRMYGRTNYMSPSPFLSELDFSNIRVLGQVPYGFKTSSGKAFAADSQKNIPSAKSPLEEKYCVGARIFHDDYGYGQIISAEYKSTGETDSESGEENSEYVISVKFENSGVKKFLPAFQSASLMICRD